MKIILLRHGKVDLDDEQWATSTEFHQWVERYNETGITVKSSPPEATAGLALQTNCIASSHLARAIESAQRLNRNIKPQIDILFAEAPLPKYVSPLIKLRIRHWLIIYRLLWLLGFSKDCESKADTLIRADKAASLLMTLALKNGMVLLAGHGFFNRYLSKALKRQGWVCKNHNGNGYWSLVELVKT